MAAARKLVRQSSEGVKVIVTYHARGTIMRLGRTPCYGRVRRAPLPGLRAAKWRTAAGPRRAGARRGANPLPKELVDT